MNASYRLQLTPDFTFEDVRALLPYFQKLGVSHLYLSPITEAREGSTHGYDVINHNQVREAFGGAEGFERLREEAQAHGLSFILDYVPNHAGVGPRNVYWQDVLAYGPNSAHADFFDIDWTPVKPELQNKVLLPFLGSPYGDVLDGGELGLAFDDGRFYATYYDNLFALYPGSYAQILERMMPSFERTERYFDLKDLTDDYASLEPSQRDRAEGLRTRLLALGEQIDLESNLPTLETEEMHDLLEGQFFRLSYWQTAGSEINYRRFFDINELVGLRMESPEVFWDAHRTLGELLVKEGMDGVRIDHIDGLFDPHGYLEQLKASGSKKVWVEKILAHGEVLPEAWPVEGTSGYEFMNDAMGVLLYQEGELSVTRAYRRFLGDFTPFEEEVHNAKRLVMETSLAGELSRLAGELNELSEADYHTRDFTLDSLQEALAEVIAAFPRYRTYLPFDKDEAKEIVREAVQSAKRRNLAAELSVYDFIERSLIGDVKEDLRGAQDAFIGRFQQYTAPVTAKGIEDTTFYRYIPLVALNEVGGEPEHFGTDAHGFHSRARFRAYRYPDNLLATATHDHKRGEDTRMRLIALAEHTDAWEEVLGKLDDRAQVLRQRRTETTPFQQSVTKNDAYLFYQLLVALWVGEEPNSLAERLEAYMEKAVREAKVNSSWLNPNGEYEEELKTFVREMTTDEEVAQIVEPLAQDLAKDGFLNGVSQLILKLTTPGVPDFYQGTELLDLSLVDPDNRRPVDYEERNALLDEMAPLFENPDADTLSGWLREQKPRAKLYVMAQLLELRGEQDSLFRGDYRDLEVTGEGCEFFLAFTREAEDNALLVVVPRFPAMRAEKDLSGVKIAIPEDMRGRGWRGVLSGAEVEVGEFLEPASLPLPFAVLVSLT